MKKTYIVTAIILELLVLTVFLAGTGFYTYIVAEKEMQKNMEQAEGAAEHGTRAMHIQSERDLIAIPYYYSWNDYFQIRYGQKGIYGRVTLNDGTRFDTSSDYWWVYLAGDHTVTKEEVRIFFLDEECEDRHMYDPVFEAECDDLFIHGGKVTASNRTYKLADIDYTVGDRVPTSAWKNNDYLYCTKVRTAKNNTEKRLNKEAEKLLDDLITKRADGDYAPTKQEDIRTSYYFVSISTKYGNYYTLQLFHPVEIALSSNKAVYIILAATFILIEAVIAFVMSKLYKNRKEYDMKSRRLSRGVAHELKTPLAVTKAYMDNWDYLTEEERASYAKKVNREVEDMTSLINALLEMDKIDSGSLKPEIEEVDLASLIRSVYNRIRPLAEERSLDVKLPEEEEVIIKTDLKLMKIALGNYITNMVKYADKRAEIRFSMTGSKVSVIFKNDSANDKKSNTDKINNNGMGVEINENIMKILGIACGSYMKGKETIFWFEADRA